MKKIGVGKITEVYRNYGMIMTSSFQKENELFPFEISKEMLKENDSKTFFHYTKNVEFELKSIDGFRRRGRMLEAVNIRSVGTEIIEFKLPEDQSYLEKVRSKFGEFSFEIPKEILSDNDLYEWLKGIDFQPRMLDYLIDGVFVSDKVLSITVEKYEQIAEEIVFDPRLIVAVDHVDKSFRNHLLSWILGIEDAYKSFISRISSNDIGGEIAQETILDWKNKNTSGKKQFEKARNAKRFRRVSDSFNYVESESVSIEDIMEELDLSDLMYFVKLWYEKSKRRFYSPYLELMVDNINLIEELFVLRNAAAHGKPIIPNFMDPDYNPNWDLEFDNPDCRTKVENWELYNPLKEIWVGREMSAEHISSIIQTIFGNPYRRSWMVLNYIYFLIIRYISDYQFQFFLSDAQKFLNYETDNEKMFQQLSSVNLLDTKLANMGPTTISMLTGIPEPYKEIANEAYDVWRIFEN